MQKLEDLSEHMKLFLANERLLQTLSEASRYDIQVANVWVESLCNKKVPHGPLLGWGKMKGHELYMHEWAATEKPFLMVRVPGSTYKECLSLQ